MQLSEKELLMISESLKGHLSTVEKLRSFSQACTDQEMKQLLDNHARKMESHSQELFNMVQTSAMTGTSGYSPYSQAHQYGGGQYGGSQYGGSQYGTQPSITQSQYGIGSQSQGSTQHGIGFQSQPGTPHYGQGTQQGMGTHGQWESQSQFRPQSQYGSPYGQSLQRPGETQQGMGTQSQFGSQSQYGTQSQYGSPSQIGSQSPYQQKY